ncbi:uncharacterized protein LOC122331907 [Puntigrus tetrazona]|uniref:uncharacterized protein LOC122331907 n=1 Tax=Puntigrus tetrazona TaxID=1606681 RepID=UPI001C88F2EE|nr:uncharacterized protein LOC122331907 [Puntigrus tetrazona]
MEMVSVSCSEVQTPAGFLYLILPVLLNHTNNPDCEQSWKTEDGLKVADPSDPQKLISPVISVSSDRLVSSLCVNLNHEIICDSADGTHFSRVTAFRVRNETAVIPNSEVLNEVTPDQYWWISALIVIVPLVLICFCLRKRFFRCSFAERKEINRRSCNPPSGRPEKSASAPVLSLRPPGGGRRPSASLSKAQHPNTRSSLSSFQQATHAAGTTAPAPISHQPSPYPLRSLDQMNPHQLYSLPYDLNPTGHRTEPCNLT